MKRSFVMDCFFSLIRRIPSFEHCLPSFRIITTDQKPGEISMSLAIHCADPFLVMMLQFRSDRSR